MTTMIKWGMTNSQKPKPKGSTDMNNAKKGTFGTWTSNFDGVTKEVGLYRDSRGNVEKKMFTCISDAIAYGFNKGYERKTGVPYHQFLLGEFHRIQSHKNL